MIKSQYETEVYRKYTAKCLQVICENTAMFVGGKTMQASYSDIIRPKPQDTRTADEIILDIVQRHGLEVKG